MWPFSRPNKPEHKPAKRDVPIAKLKRYYEAAQQSDLHFGWDMVPVPTQWLIRNSLRVLRARSREQVQNNDYAKRFLQVLTMNVVGANGFTFQSQIQNNTSQKQDQQANQFIESMMADWSRRENFDVTGRMDRDSHSRLFIRQVAMDGEYLARIVRGKRAGRHGIQIQVLDPEILPVWYEKDLGAGSYIQSGIEFNALGKPLAYHLMAYGPNEDTYSYYGRKFVRVPAQDIIHEFVTELVNQYRGLPWLATPLTAMKMLAGYEESALVAARVGASNMAFFKRTANEELPADVESPTGDLEMEAEPGVFRELPPGMSVDAWNPKYPDAQFPTFIKASLRRIASGLGVSYNTLANDLEGVNYSSLREGALQDRDAWSVIQSWMAEVFLDRLYREWLHWQMTTGGVTLPMAAPASLNFSNENKYLRVKWLPRRWQWVDPEKEMSANTASILHRLKSRSQIIREMGHDPERVWDEIARENEILQQKGITIPQETPQKVTATETEKLKD